MRRARWYTAVVGWGLVLSCAGAGPATRPDKSFLEDCAVRGLQIVQLSKIASIKADSDKTQKFANEVLGRQATLNTRIKSVADEMGIALNVQIDPAQQQQIDQLSSQYGRRLDRDYLRQIIKLQSQLLKSAQARTQGAFSTLASRIIASAKGMIADARSLAPKIGVSLEDPAASR